MLSPTEVQALLESVDRQGPGGRRSYAILLLLTTYGLRPVDVSRLRLDDLQWREQRLALVQKKTGQVVVLPLLPEVATAIYNYLRHERAPDLLDRRVFVSLKWPHRPVCARTISDIAVQAMQEASLSGGRTKHLRPSVATHLLRQGEAFSTIQEVLGHRTAETTQRYAVTDVELLRQVIEETQR
jgi:integrase